MRACVRRGRWSLGSERGAATQVCGSTGPAQPWNGRKPPKTGRTWFFNSQPKPKGTTKVANGDGTKARAEQRREAEQGVPRVNLAGEVCVGGRCVFCLWEHSASNLGGGFPSLAYSRPLIFRETPSWPDPSRRWYCRSEDGTFRNFLAGSSADSRIIERLKDAIKTITIPFARAARLGFQSTGNDQGRASKERRDPPFLFTPHVSGSNPQGTASKEARRCKLGTG